MKTLPQWDSFFLRDSLNDEITLGAMRLYPDLAYDKLLSSSYSYISRPEVRSFIFERDGYRCTYCGGTKRLCIDHIRPIKYYAANKIFNTSLNAAENLQTLCIYCNSHKHTS